MSATVIAGLRVVMEDCRQTKCPSLGELLKSIVILHLFKINLTQVEMSPRIPVSLLPQTHKFVCFFLSFTCTFNCKLCILNSLPMDYYATTKSLRLSYSYVVMESYP